MRCYARSANRWRDDAGTKYTLDLRGTLAENRAAEARRFTLR